MVGNLTEREVTEREVMVRPMARAGVPTVRPGTQTGPLHA